MIIILQILWFGLPAGLSNAAAPLSKKLLPMFSTPVDLGKEINGKRLLGTNKTYRGFIIGTIVATLFFLLQKYLYAHSGFFQDISLINYTETSIFAGPALGFGALFGDSVESFFKRRFNIKPGEPWFPFDQIDWILGTFLCVFPFVDVSVKIFLLGIIIGLVSHLIVKFSAYMLKLEDKPI